MCKGVYQKIHPQHRFDFEASQVTWVTVNKALILPASIILLMY